jgi:transketolase
MRKQFKDTILDLATSDDRIVMVLGDVSVYLMNEFQQKYPDRFYNLGICENTIISVSAGLSSQGLIPFAHTIAPFITERSYEQIKLDLCYNRFGGNIVSCGASFDYAWDGATHHTYTDLAILRLLPECDVLQPGSRKELDVLMRSRYASGKTTYYRLSDHPHAVDMPVEFGKGVVLKDSGSGVTVMTAGPLLGNVLEACRDLPVNLVYFHTIKPIDRDLIAKYANTRILVVHDAFGLQEAIHEVPGVRTSYHGLPDAFCGWYGRLEDIRKKIGLDAVSIRERVQKSLAEAG